jgi:hypothetical protein
MELYKEKLKEIENIPILHNKALHHVFEHRLVNDFDLWLEFGTYDGRSINKISRYTNRQIFGFDSFEGLPEEWVGRGFPKGCFDLGGAQPNFNPEGFFVYDNVKLIKGWFNESIPVFLENFDKPISFLHIDCDIYSSTKDIFNTLYANIQNGCVIVFDEMFDYNNFQEHEWRAWWEFVEERNIKFEWIGCNLGNVIIDNGITPKFGAGTPSEHVPLSPSSENAAVKIINNPSYKF